MVVGIFFLIPSETTVSGIDYVVNLNDGAGVKGK